MGRPRKVKRDQVIVTSLFKVVMDDLRPSAGLFYNPEEAFLWAKNNLKFKEGEDKDLRARNSVQPIVKKTLRPLPAEV